jgi:opacity protein-like surface antigen
MSSSPRARIGIAALAVCLASPAFADGTQGAYVGGGVGPGRVEAGTGFPLGGSFDQSHLAYHLDFGIHPPVAPLALELEYIDLGQPHASTSAGSQTVTDTVSQRGGGLFLLYYLPTPIVQVYAKAGGSRITTHADSTVCSIGGCNGSAVGATNNAFAFGAGLQWTFGPWAVRGEYERFDAAGGHPNLLTVGIDWTFL